METNSIKEINEAECEQLNMWFRKGSKEDWDMLSAYLEKRDWSPEELCAIFGFAYVQGNGEDIDDFLIDKFATTQHLWESVMDNNPSHNQVGNTKNHPVERVSWNDCVSFVKKLNSILKIKGYKFDMIYEKEWMWAAKGGVKSKGYTYSGSNNAKKVAWFSENSDGHTHECGQLLPNELGIYDMSGNVCEWLKDEL